MAKYKDDTKAAVMASLLAGQSVSQVAKEYDIPRGTVAGWSSKLNSAGIPTVSNTKKNEQIGDLLLEYLVTNLETLKAQAEVFKNPDWLHKQNAADAAVLHGVLTDKAVRLLEALSNASSD